RKVLAERSSWRDAARASQEVVLEVAACLSTVAPNRDAHAENQGGQEGEAEDDHPLGFGWSRVRFGERDGIACSVFAHGDFGLIDGSLQAQARCFQVCLDLQKAGVLLAIDRGLACQLAASGSD